MKALSIHQPQASLIAHGIKQYETRAEWYSREEYQGDILICSGVVKNGRELYEHLQTAYKIRVPFWNNEYNRYYDFRCCWWNELLFGYALCIANITGQIEIRKKVIEQQSELEKESGCWTRGWYAYKIENIRLIEPVKVKGKRGIFDVDIEPIFL